MANSSRKSDQNKESTGKVGGSVEAARQVGSKNDFGIPAKQAQPHDMRPNVGAKDSEDHEDDHRPIEGFSTEGQRTRGVGSKGRGKPGAGSGGDLDTDLLGVGTDGIGISATGPDDDLGGKAAVPAEKPKSQRKVPPLTVPKGGTFIDRGDRIDGVADVEDDGQGMASGTDSASAGEVSADEASGRNDAGD